MRIFSGIQPRGEIHIGNYLGALRQWVELQKENECIFCIVDLHSLTVPYEPLELGDKIREKAIAYLAAGIDPEKSIIFIQSKVPEHSELNWLLSTITPIGDLQRMTQFKEKSKKFKKNVNAGLLNYPVLMAADILLYNTEKVPVGKDQVQHVELAREIARRFNKKFKKIFTLPQAFLPKEGAKIMSLAEPEKKMSKSDPSQTYVSLFDTEKKIKEKIMAAQTDSGREIKYNLAEKPGISNLLTIYSIFAKKKIQNIENQFQGKGYGEFKKELAEILIEKLKPFRDKEKELHKNPQKLEVILEKGQKRARAIAQKNIEKVKKNMGLI